ncbi:MAG: hypothetical protein N2170_07470 [Bacteroidia bacterium]|nr:hypothetical protein [Bacteroidia bacterium]
MRPVGILFALAGWLACSSPSPTAGSMGEVQGIHISVDRLALPYCPECEMHFGRYPVADTLTYEGKLYGFCSQGCKEAFVKRMAP